MTVGNEQHATSSGHSKNGPDWENPDIPVGDSPPMPMWPLVLSVVAWLGGIAFLLAMMKERLG